MSQRTSFYLIMFGVAVWGVFHFVLAYTSTGRPLRIDIRLGLFVADCFVGLLAFRTVRHWWRDGQAMRGVYYNKRQIIRAAYSNREGSADRSDETDKYHRRKLLARLGCLLAFFGLLISTVGESFRFGGLPPRRNIFFYISIIGIVLTGIALLRLPKSKS